jgi:hypothetical protein
MFRIRTRLMLVGLGLLGFAGGSVLAQLQPAGPQLKPAPPIDCGGTVTYEWRPTPVCGRYGESPMSIPGEYRCVSVYDDASRSCKQHCVWTGNCREP